MTTATRTYLQETVRLFDLRIKVRAGGRASGRLRNWEKKIYDGARMLLAEEQQDIPGMNPDGSAGASAKGGL